MKRLLRKEVDSDGALWAKGFQVEGSASKQPVGGASVAGGSEVRESSGVGLVGLGKDLRISSEGSDFE